MELRPLGIPGVHEVVAAKFDDQRGRFVKVFHEDVFREKGLTPRFAEEYYSVSFRNVLRGMHFQLPPRAHEKMVYCVEGEVLDVLVDLRKGSPTYLSHAEVSLSAENARALYIPAGLAHGFYVLSERAVMVYKVTSVYSPEHDSGIRWDSAGIPWPGNAPVVSARDAGFAPLASFDSPFTYR